MKIAFFPGYACHSSIFGSMAKHFPGAFFYDYPLAKMSDVTNLKKLCDMIEEKHGSELQECQIFVGHSLGGGISMELSKREGFRHVKVVLLDYFLQFPPKFFRNYCSKETPEKTHTFVNKMLEQFKPKFNVQLMFSVTDYTVEKLSERHQINQRKILAIYGMRSQKDPEVVSKELGYPEEFYEYIDLEFVERSAHFPSLENPEAVAVLINSQINGL